MTHGPQMAAIVIHIASQLGALLLVMQMACAKAKMAGAILLGLAAIPVKCSLASSLKANQHALTNQIVNGSLIQRQLVM